MQIKYHKPKEKKERKKKETRRKFKEAEDTAKCLLLDIPESLSYHSRLNQNPKLQANSYIIRRSEKPLGNILLYT